MTTHYEVLGIPSDAPPEAIRRAFRALAKTTHPDTDRGGEAPMVRLNEAYATLSDPVKRRAYDATLRRPAPVPRATRPATPRGPVAVPPTLFLSRVFAPLDARMREAAAMLEAAIVELSYDLYDDAHLAAFEAALRRADGLVAEADLALRGNPWPDGLSSPLNLYRQGLRQVEDATEDFHVFLGNLDADLLVEGRAILRGGVELMGEARERLDRMR